MTLSQNLHSDLSLPKGPVTMLALTSSDRAQLIANGRARLACTNANEPEPDHIPVVKLIDDIGGAWLLTEIYPDDPETAFGLCDLGVGSPELGDVSLLELANAGGRIRRDDSFKPMFPLSEYIEMAWMTGIIGSEPRPLLTEAMRAQMLENGKIYEATHMAKEPEFDFYPVVRFQFPSNNLFLLTFLFPDNPEIAYGLNVECGCTSIGKIELSRIKRLIFNAGGRGRDDAFKATMPLTGYAIALLKRSGEISRTTYPNGRNFGPSNPQFDEIPY